MQDLGTPVVRVSLECPAENLSRLDGVTETLYTRNIPRGDGVVPFALGEQGGQSSGSTVTMSEQSTSGKIPLSIFLTPDLAARLEREAKRLNRPAGDVAAEVLERHLPRLPAGPPKPGNIPYA